MISFAERLKRARERAGMTQADVMKRIGLSTKAISRYETGTAAPDPETITELCRIYDVSADYIMGFSLEMGYCHGGSSSTPPRIATDPDEHELLEQLSAESRRKAKDYLEMLKTMEEVKSAAEPIDLPKKNA